ncbi:helix-turn-helix transcriptional regulator [Dyadobacter sp. CY345]|uniref:helix-turn-helix domain-containing protein n=1 Tax=Dyadobacter sp. CY345 TaxID=2909335 RepID=UPI001F2CCAEB|nr:helix-turn-helix transcriptional regulator [Dyadobacter sp. CY345]MCF2443659.1 helix-turn-helix transcriptional regulator [Dyadobacter sp. CY345]
MSIEEIIYSQIPDLEKESAKTQMIISSRIDDIMADKSLSIPEFAALVDKDVDTVHDWLSGGHVFDTNELTLIAMAFNCKISNLLSVKIHSHKYNFNKKETTPLLDLNEFFEQFAPQKIHLETTKRYSAVGKMDMEFDLN